MLKIENEANIAYLVGFMAGDGSYSNGWGKRTDRLDVGTTDVEIVEWFNTNVLDFTTANPRLNNNEARGIIAKLPSYRVVFPAKWVDFFNKYGILSKKVDRTVVNISKKNMKYYMLGLFDADGCISWGHRTDRDRVTGKISYSHPSFNLLQYLQNFLMNELNICSSIRPKKGEACFVLEFSKIDSVLKFCSWMYSDFVVLNRKYQIFLDLEKEIGVRRDDGRSYPREFMDSEEYHEVIGSVSKYVFIFDGKEYPAANLAAKVTGNDRKEVHRWARTNCKGWSLRPKTEQEKEDYKNYSKKLILKLYKEWQEKQ